MHIHKSQRPSLTLIDVIILPVYGRFLLKALAGRRQREFGAGGTALCE